MLGMYEQLKYINHLGSELDFGANGLYVNENDLHDFAWSVITMNDKISGFERGIQTRTIPVRIAADTDSNGITFRDNLFEIPERDVLANKYGKLYINGYYCECFITASKKSAYSKQKNCMAIELTITTDRPYWVKQAHTDYPADPSWYPVTDTGLDYPHDFLIDYGPSTRRWVTTENTGAFNSDFRLEIEGLVENPRITINDHDYSVDGMVYHGETLIIDSINKTVLVYDAVGGVRNYFNNRNRDSYIFQPIPSGNLTIRWSNDFDFTLYLMEERSEPKWAIPQQAAQEVEEETEETPSATIH